MARPGLTRIDPHDPNDSGPAILGVTWALTISCTPLVGLGDAALGGDLQEEGEEHGPVGGGWARVEFVAQVEAEGDDEGAGDC